MKPPKLAGLCLAVLLLAACGLLGSCDRAGHASGDDETAAEADGGDKKAKQETAVPVEVIDLGRGEIEAVLRFSTNLVAEKKVKIHAQAARFVREILVEEGTGVRSGQVLLKLQDDEQLSALAKVQSQYQKAERERARLQRLFAQELITEQAFSEATFEYEQLAIALEDARREVGYTQVRAPFAGTITQRLVNVGDQVTVGQHLFDLVDFDSLVAPIYVPEKELARLGEGQTARLAGQGASTRLYTGSIERIAPVVDPRTGTVKVLVGLDERRDLRPGMYVDVELLTAVHQSALLVPKRTLVYDKDEVYVYRLKAEERRVERVRIAPLLGDANNIEPVDGTLAEGDQIISAGQAGLKDGALVRLPGDPEPPTSKPDTEA